MNNINDDDDEKQHIGIQSKSFVTEQVATKIKLRVLRLEFNSYVDIQVLFLHSSGYIIDTQVVRIEGSEYSNWGYPDDYMIDLVLSKLNLSRTDL